MGYSARQLGFDDVPRMPLCGKLDVTYRCNHACLHCWVRKPAADPSRASELSFDEIKAIVGQARRLGTREWHLSGGEPMLREDFADIFDFITRQSANYRLNSNATLITPAIAQLLRRKGVKMMSLYGATAATYDRVTGHPGGFEQAMRGLRYLQEAGASFVVQLVPMRDNWHEWEQMQALAQTLSTHQRVGASWLYLSAEGVPARNRQIAGQRLTPRQAIELDPPTPFGDADLQGTGCGMVAAGDDRLFAPCIAGYREFHIDAYGQMSWCIHIKDSALRYDLRQGTFHEAWEDFIPSCADKVRGGEEWQAHCGSCDKRPECGWCAVFAKLETGRYSAPIPYLCELADEARAFKAQSSAQHRRYFQLAGITVRIESDLNFDELAFRPELERFAVAGPGEDNVTLRHFFELPSLSGLSLGQEVYRAPPWAIWRQPSGSWVYQGIAPDPNNHDVSRVAMFSADHAQGRIFGTPRDLATIRRDGWHSLSLFPTDQIWLAPLLADRQAVLMHSGAAIVNGQGLVFIGHSDAGKSTTIELLKAARGQLMGGQPLEVEVLCDDRNVLRKWPASVSPGGWRVHGTWSHGTTADVSGAAAPLRAILFLEQSTRNDLVRLYDRKIIWRRLLATLVRGLTTAEWWNKELDVLQQLVAEVPCYLMRFDRSGAIVAPLAELAGERE